jgi:hypothetical protein
MVIVMVMMVMVTVTVTVMIGASPKHANKHKSPYIHAYLMVIVMVIVMVMVMMMVMVTVTVMIGAPQSMPTSTKPHMSILACGSLKSNVVAVSIQCNSTSIPFLLQCITVLLLHEAPYIHTVHTTRLRKRGRKWEGGECYYVKVLQVVK